MHVRQAEDIAIIGMAGRFPGANNIDEFWQNLCEGRESIRQFNDDELLSSGVNVDTIKEKNYIKAKGILNKVEYFDADFFKMSALEAEILDPQHRIFLLCAYEAFENASLIAKNLNDRVGVFASTGMSLYLLKNILTHPDYLKYIDEYQLLLSNDKDFLATRISYLLNLKGPSINIQTGCSSSLVCVHYACQSLLNGECDLALAGGVSITIPQTQGYFYKNEMIGSPDGHCYPFDKRAKGTVKSNGAGVVLLKPLLNAIKDNDHIYAIISGSAINNDGANKVGFTAPSVSQQAAVIKEAMQMADIVPELIEYIEAHGTGTLLGDPIEIAALKQVYSTNHNIPKNCALTSLKSNIGHLDVAAGIAGLIKATLAIYYGMIPASINFKELNPRINLDNTPFYINTELKKWVSNHNCRQAGVSAFGIGGTNVHIILKQFNIKNKMNKCEIPQVFCFSAKSQPALKENMSKLASYLKQNSNVSLNDVAYTLLHGRETMPYRAAFAAADQRDLLTKLTNIEIKQLKPINQSTSVVFMFSGQGSQYAGMAKNLYIYEPSFRYALDECLAALKPFVTHDLKKIIFLENMKPQDANEQLRQTEITQPALFAVEYALAKCFLSRGIVPVALLGHSLGEYVAAVYANIFTLKDAAKVVAIRGKLIQRLPPGNMLAVFKDPQTICSFLPKTLDISVINATHITVVAGAVTDIQMFMSFLSKQNIRYQLLQTSHAFHSQMLETILDEFGAILNDTKRSSPKLPMVSNLTGNWITDEQALSVDYWVKQLRYTVQFSACVATVQKRYAPLFIEVGPGRTLQSLVLQHGIAKTIHSLPPKEEMNSDLLTFNQALSEIWQEGIEINQYMDGKKIPLPTYSWDLKRYWIDQLPLQENKSIKNNHDFIYMNGDVIKVAWTNVLGKPPLTDQDHFFLMGGNSLAAIQFINLLPEDYHDHIHVIHIYQYPKFGDLVRFIGSINRENQVPLPELKPDKRKKILLENEVEQQIFSTQEEV